MGCFICWAQTASSLLGERQTADLPLISFGDRVRVRQTPATRAAGVAGLVGEVYGETTPSVTGIKVTGSMRQPTRIRASRAKHLVHLLMSCLARPIVGTYWDS